MLLLMLLLLLPKSSHNEPSVILFYVRTLGYIFCFRPQLYVIMLFLHDWSSVLCDAPPREAPPRDAAH